MAWQAGAVLALSASPWPDLSPALRAAPALSTSQAARGLAPPDARNAATDWRRPPGRETSYTRYPNGREKFSRHLESLCSHLESETGSRPSFNQCEVTYINTILPSGVWESHADLDKVTPLWRAVGPEGSNESIEQERLAVTVGISYQDAQVGRLHVSFSPSYDPSGNPTFILNLTARGRPIGEDVAGVLAFLDLGRTSVVNNFVRFTTSELHEVWGKL